MPPRYQESAITIRQADDMHLPAVKRLLDLHRKEFGFIRMAALVESCAQGMLMVALVDGKVVGFVRYHHRKLDGQTTLYELCVTLTSRGYGIGRRLVTALIEECVSLRRASLELKCPRELEANDFYKHIGFTLTDTTQGKFRPLNTWTLLVYDWKQRRVETCH